MVATYPLILAIALFAMGYLASWIRHGNLFKRIKNTHHYMKRGKHSLKNAWNYAGRTL